MKYTYTSEVEYIEHMGNDRSIADIARICIGRDATDLGPKEIALLSHLAKNKHWTPFAGASVHLKITAPIFVARQLAKHQVGMTWVEQSRRYTSKEWQCFEPPQLRFKKDTNVFVLESAEFLECKYREVMKQVDTLYKLLLDCNVLPEVARMCLPQAMMTTWHWTGSLYAFARVCQLRLDPKTQQETRVVAKQMHNICGQLFPHAWRALMEGVSTDVFQEMPTRAD